MKKYQGGSTMLEGLISIAIFSFGVLGTMSFQANMLAQSTQVSYKLNASMHANSLLGAAEADADNYKCYTYNPHEENHLTTLPGCDLAKAFVQSWADRARAIEGSLPPEAWLADDPSDPAVVKRQFLAVAVGWQLPSDKALEAKDPALSDHPDKYKHIFEARSMPIGS